MIKVIPNTDNLYYADTEGNIYSCLTKDKKLKKLKSNISKTRKYLSLNVRYNGKLVGKVVHKLIAETFLPNPHGKNEVNHIDGNKLNNHVSNLEWCTRQENIDHSIHVLGYKSKGTGLNKEKGKSANCNRPMKVKFPDGSIKNYYSITNFSEQTGFSYEAIISRIKKYKIAPFLIETGQLSGIEILELGRKINPRKSCLKKL